MPLIKQTTLLPFHIAIPITTVAGAIAAGIVAALKVNATTNPQRLLTQCTNSPRLQNADIARSSQIIREQFKDLRQYQKDNQENISALREEIDGLKTELRNMVKMADGYRAQIREIDGLKTELRNMVRMADGYRAQIKALKDVKFKTPGSAEPAHVRRKALETPEEASWKALRTREEAWKALGTPEEAWKALRTREEASEDLDTDESPTPPGCWTRSKNTLFKYMPYLGIIGFSYVGIPLIARSAFQYTYPSGNTAIAYIS